MSPSEAVQLFQYNSIGRVLFGVNAAEQVGAEASRLVEGRKCLIITDAGIVRAGLTDRIARSLEREGFAVELCDKAQPEPTVAVYKAVLEVAQSKRPVVIIGVGGGSSLDVSKVVARALTHPGPLENYLRKEFDHAGVPLITIPTTSGTAAEVTPDAVVLLPEERVKSCFLNTRATVAIVDPTMTLSLPPHATAATGVDALSHAVESALSAAATPLTQALALESIRLISGSLRAATSDGRNLAARTDMAWATLMEGFSESNAGDVEGHAVAHLIGGYYRIHHGQACGIALPYCMKYNLPVNVPILARIARAMDDSISGAPESMAEKGICAVHQLIQDVGAPSKIPDIKTASRDHIPELVRLYRTHPDITGFLSAWAKRGVPTEAEATAFFEEMFEPFSIPLQRC